jgi:hypothetical protein
MYSVRGGEYVFHCLHDICYLQDAIGKYSLLNVTSGEWTYKLTCNDTAHYQRMLNQAALWSAAAMNGDGDGNGNSNINGTKPAKFDQHSTESTISTLQATGARSAVHRAATPILVTVNMEMFSRTTAGTTVTGDPAEHGRRHCCYASHGLLVGPSWDIKDWYQAQFTSYDPVREAQAAQIPVAPQLAGVE